MEGAGGKLVAMDKDRISPAFYLQEIPREWIIFVLSGSKNTHTFFIFSQLSGTYPCSSGLFALHWGRGSDNTSPSAWRCLLRSA